MREKKNQIIPHPPHEQKLIVLLLNSQPMLKPFWLFEPPSDLIFDCVMFLHLPLSAIKAHLFLSSTKACLTSHKKQDIFGVGVSS